MGTIPDSGADPRFQTPDSRGQPPDRWRIPRPAPSLPESGIPGSGIRARYPTRGGGPGSPPGNPGIVGAGASVAGRLSESATPPVVTREGPHHVRAPQEAAVPGEGRRDQPEVRPEAAGA